MQTEGFELEDDSGKKQKKGGGGAGLGVFVNLLVETDEAVGIVFDEAIEYEGPCDEHNDEPDGFEKLVFALKYNVDLRHRVDAFGERYGDE